ncbi:unnamed protein product [Nesidiocoris tenuis]|uniref:Uncharacterized protein n=1 Tax=Nesidiocoris tenuis TaxID=355587 RepID=A0A6H5FV10_9HEMI|nr:unnamed protein product [Nesidiocoris tenuis]
MTTPAKGERFSFIDRHASRHDRVHGPTPLSHRRAGLSAALIPFKTEFVLGSTKNDAPDDGRTAEGFKIWKYCVLPTHHWSCMFLIC